MAVTILDGRALALAREPELRQRAARVAREQGRAPRLLVVAFADAHGAVPWVDAKLAACRRAGVDVRVAALPPSADTADVTRAVRGMPADAVFVQVPFPAGVDPDEALRAIPLEADIDVMSPLAVDRYERDPAANPPLTVAAALDLLDQHGVALEGRAGVVVGSPDPYHRMFRLALGRRGARMAPLADPAAPGVPEAVEAAELVVLSAASPGLVPSDRLRAGAAVIDAGYFNPGGRGDLDTGPGVAHLAALAPVPGGVGPMTVSVLLERVIEAAERADPGSLRR